MKIDEPKSTPMDCRCPECGTIHSEFINIFGHWPKMTHEEGQRLKRNRLENEQSWKDGMRGDFR